MIRRRRHACSTPGTLGQRRHAGLTRFSACPRDRRVPSLASAQLGSNFSSFDQTRVGGQRQTQQTQATALASNTEGHCAPKLCKLKRGRHRVHTTSLGPSTFGGINCILNTKTVETVYANVGIIVAGRPKRDRCGRRAGHGTIGWQTICFNPKEGFQKCYVLHWTLLLRVLLLQFSSRGVGGNNRDRIACNPSPQPLLPIPQSDGRYATMEAASAKNLPQQHNCFVGSLSLSVFPRNAKNERRETGANTGMRYQLAEGSKRGGGGKITE